MTRPMGMEKVLSVREAARMLHRSREFVIDLINNGTIRADKTYQFLWSVNKRDLYAYRRRQYALQEEFVGSAEFSRMLGIETKTFHHRAQAGLIPAPDKREGRIKFWRRERAKKFAQLYKARETRDQLPGPKRFRIQSDVTEELLQKLQAVAAARNISVSRALAEAAADYVFANFRLIKENK